MRHTERMQKHHFTDFKKGNVSKIYQIIYVKSFSEDDEQQEQEGWRRVITFITAKSFESAEFDTSFSEYIFKSKSCFYVADPLMKCYQLFVREISSENCYQVTQQKQLLMYLYLIFFILLYRHTWSGYLAVSTIFNPSKQIK